MWNLASQVSWYGHMSLFCIILVLVVGVVFRFANLGGLVYWGDEVYSSLRILGYTTVAMAHTIAQGNPVSAVILQQFQLLSPITLLQSSSLFQQLGVSATVASLLREDSHLTPLYFILVRLWIRLLGDSVVTIRSFSVVCSLLLLLSLYWLAMLLFGQRCVAITVVLLAVVSPMHLLFAQEARMYALWLLLSILSQALLLVSLRQKTWNYWGCYTIVTIAAIYSHLLGIIPMVFNGIYVLMIYPRDRSVLPRFGLSVSLVVMAIMPWLWAFWTRPIVKQEDGTDAPLNLMASLQNWSSLFRRLFADFNTSSGDSIASAIILTSISLFCLVLVALALYRLYRETTRPIWLFVVLLILALPLGLLPMSWRGLLPSRYVLPSYVGLQLALGYLLGTRLEHCQSRRWMWSIVTAIVLSLGLISCGLIVRSDGWWSKGFSECNPAAARLINQTAHPLVITDGTGAPFFDHPLSNAISLSLRLKPTTQFQIVLEPNLPKLVPGEYSDRFVLTPSAHLRQWLEQEYVGKLEPLLSLRYFYRGSKICLWRLND